MTELSADKLAQFISNITFEKVPVSVREQIRWRLLDALSTLLGDETNVMRLVPITSQGRSGHEQASVAAEGRALSLESAQIALSVGALLEAGPLPAWSTQAFAKTNASIIAAAWSAVESTGGNGRLLMEALATGYAAAAVLAEGVPDDDTLAGRVGACSAAVGAAAAAAKAQGLSATATLNAMGFAAGQAAQLAEDTNKRSDAVGQSGAARAAMDGVLSAHMAATGAVSPADLINLLRQGRQAVPIGADAWQLALDRQPAPTADQSAQRFRERLSASNGMARIDAIIKLIARLEHTEPGVIRSCILP